ncbi:hypothetical protein [Altericista sp. CCNU0014]
MSLPSGTLKLALQRTHCMEKLHLSLLVLAGGGDRNLVSRQPR